MPLGRITGPVTGAAPLTPIQHWFFASDPGSAARSDQSLTLELADGVDVAALQTALAAVLVQHDALRMRFEPAATGWRQYNAGSEQAPERVCERTAIWIADREVEEAGRIPRRWARAG